MKQFTEELIGKAIEWISGNEGVNIDSTSDAVAPWAASEVAKFCEFIQQKRKESLPDNNIKTEIENKIKKDKKNGIPTFAESFNNSADIALWGRMATSGLMTSIDGSLAVAHAITTHAAQADTDWFTAVDDLIQDSGEVGAGHLDTQEFSSGVFYRYASLNIAQLQKNLGGASRERALEIAKHVFHMLCTVVPSAKQQSFAAHNSADFAIVSFADQPISMANAFEKPIEKAKAGGYYKPSIEKLIEYWKSSNGFYNLQENAACCSKDTEVVIAEGLAKKNSLLDVETWISNDGKAN
jgi:CRISPR system Cascade subunit CasC